jgi:hypothetical protein
MELIFLLAIMVAEFNIDEIISPRRISKQIFWTDGDRRCDNHIPSSATQDKKRQTNLIKGCVGSCISLFLTEFKKEIISFLVTSLKFLFTHLENRFKVSLLTTCVLPEILVSVFLV